MITSALQVFMLPDLGEGHTEAELVNLLSPQPADRGGRDETGPEHLPFGDFAQPHGVENVGLLPPWQMPGIPGVDQPRLEPVRLEKVKHRLPVTGMGVLQRTQRLDGVHSTRLRPRALRTGLSQSASRRRRPFDNALRGWLSCRTTGRRSCAVLSPCRHCRRIYVSSA